MFSDYVDSVERAHRAACDAANEDPACIAWADHKRAMALDARPDCDGYTDCTFDELCDLHDDAVACDDYAWADRLKAALSARPEYAEHMELVAQSIRAEESEDLDVPF